MSMQRRVRRRWIAAVGAVGVLLIGAALVPWLAAQETPPPAQPHQHEHNHNHDAGAPNQPVRQLETGGGNDWFEKTRLNLGTFYDEEEAIGHFAFKNPRDDSHKITGVNPSCACAKAIVKRGATIKTAAANLNRYAADQSYSV